MPRLRFALLLILPAALLSCARESDQFKPHIIITSPEGGAVSANKSFTLKGYVLDDKAVALLKVQGEKVPIKAGSKIAPFSYQTSIKGDTTTLSLLALDSSGNKTTLELPLRVDNTPPVIRVTKFERDNKIIRVSGVVTDNTSVAQVSVDGSVLNITPGNSTEFYAETTGTYADIEAKDGAGNVAQLRAR
ncbi:hypothetical protein EHF33_03225 [Deinococcus psychrotolerans]|uniref:Uncharacterized protein n=2 Tax=Deinococcus TaxID=1298 RepID=A0A553UWF3_9DEIO|nr:MULTISPECIES: hypothetical protein [Deinococcus]AZI41883.1 hypothetical protein EHF33_03225 [Deinococcus psychrotolerans]TSA84519.1 hypothetical protein FNU79_11205 [Deinococcus detaillensis]